MSGDLYARPLHVPSDSRPQPDVFPEWDTAAPRSPAASGRSWLRYLAVLAAVLLLAFFLPSPYPFWALLALVLVAVLVSALDAGLTPGRVVRAVVSTPAHARNAALAFLHPDSLPDTRRQAFGRRFGLLACLFMALAALGYRPAQGQPSLDVPVLLTVAGALTLGIAVRLGSRFPVADPPTSLPLAPARPAWGAMMLGVLGLALVAFISIAKGLRLPQMPFLSLHAEFLLFAAGVGLVVWGLAGAPRTSWLAIAGRLRSREFLALLAMVAVALVLRSWEIGESIRGSVDEAVILEGVGHAYGNREAGLVSQVSNYLPISQLYAYWQTISIDLFGHTVEALRLPNALVGALGVFAIYLLARALFDVPTALIAALFLATFPPHLHFSRIAMSQIADPLFGTLALAFLVRAMRGNRRLDWALAGAALGLTHYFYEGGRLFFTPFVAAAVVVWALLYGRRLRDRWRGLLVAFLAFCFLIATVYAPLFAMDKPRASRLEESGLSLDFFQSLAQDGLTGDDASRLLHRLSFPFQVYVHQPEISRYYGGHQALVLDYLVPLFLLGLAYIVWRARSFAVALLLWVVLVALGNSLMRDMASYPRYVVVLPALALLMAVGVRHVVPLVWPARGRALLVVPLAALSVIVAAGQIGYYFGQHLPVYRTQLRNLTAYDGMDAVLRAAELPTSAQVYLIGDPPYDGEVARVFDTFLSGRAFEMRLQSVSPSEITPEFVAALPRDRDYAFFLAPGSEAVLDTLRAAFLVDMPQSSPHAIPDDREYSLYYARARDS